MKRAQVLAVLFVLACSAGARAGDYDPLHTTIGTLPEFQLTDQNGNVVQREQLLGKVCVVSFFFSCCTSACPQTQATMEALQRKFADWPDVLLVSINVFPSNDSQEILAGYARGHNADPKRWLFLRGQEKDIYDLVQGGFKQGLARNPEPTAGNEVLHTPNFLVVDHRGVIRGYADGSKADQVEQLERFVVQLVEAKYFPMVNASLNATCAVLLVVGFVLIRCRWVLAHKVVMLSALLVSAVFLASYLYYHFAVLEGRSTTFSGEETMRFLYLAILFSHMLLAAAVAPLALTVTYLGLRNRLARHVGLARWTLPLWLYVSVTGVVVYWMLYHLYPPV
jgi:protein SCO1/2/putative membrane protein